MSIANRGWVAGWVVSLAAAGWLGHHLADGSRASSVPAPAAPIEASPAARAAPAAGLGADQIRAILRDELARQLADLQPHAGAANPTEPPGDAGAPAGLSPELQAKADEAAAVIDRATAAGQWSNDERLQFETATQGLPPRAVFALQRQVIAAVNLGRISLQDHAFPFGPPH